MSPTKFPISVPRAPRAQREEVVDLPLGLGKCVFEEPPLVELLAQDDLKSDEEHDRDVAHEVESESDSSGNGDSPSEDADEPVPSEFEPSSDEEPPEAPPVAPPPRLEDVLGGSERAGLSSFERAATTRAFCFVCGTPVARDTWRLRYQARASKAFRDNRACHTFCVRDLPNGSRDRDIAVVEFWLADPGTPADAEGCLKAVLEDLRNR